MYAADDGDLPTIASSSGGLNSIFGTVSSVSPRSRRSGDGDLGTYGGGRSSAHGGDCSPVFSEGREPNLEIFEETNLGRNRSLRVAGKSTKRITKNIDCGDLTVESSASSATPSPLKVKIELKELVPFLTSFDPNGQSKFKLISRRSNGRLTTFKVPVPIEERRTVFQSYRSDGKLSISLAKYSDQEEEQRKENKSGGKGED